MHVLFFKVSGWLLFGCFLTTSAFAKTLHVYDWPFLETISQDKPHSHIGADPILGSLSCLPFSRLNLIQKSSYPVIFTNMQERKLGGHNYAWEFALNTDLKWWGGEAISSQHIADFLQSNLAGIIGEKSLGLWSQPAFQISTPNPQKLIVQWQVEPSFGVYILNGVAPWRAVKARSGNQKFECIGSYVLETQKDRLVLVDRRLAKSDAFEKIVLHSDNAAKKTSDHWLQFEFAEQNVAANQCPRKIEVPLMSVVQWNTERGFTKSAKFRQTMTQLLPRGELFRAGSLKMGDLVSGLILRAHPGYNRKVLVRSYDQEKSNQELSEMGYKRVNLAEPRKNAEGKALQLNIWAPRSPSAQPNLIEKVLVDNFAATGIIAQINNESQMPDRNTIDGAISGLILDWPEQNYLADLHSKSKSSGFIWPLADAELDGLLEAYARSLTRKVPDFALLQKIHAKTFELEPFSIIMQHSACIRVDEKFGKELSAILIRDPDWFKKLIEI